MEGKRVFVTGGAGFIGSNLANHLAEATEVVVVDDGYLGTAENLNSDVEFQKKGVLDEDLPTDVDYVFHLAALPSYAVHEDDPTTGTRVNVEGFVNTVEQARDDGCDTVVYASTSSIYGNRTEPSPEDMDVEVNTSYEARSSPVNATLSTSRTTTTCRSRECASSRSIRATAGRRNTRASTRT